MQGTSNAETPIAKLETGILYLVCVLVIGILGGTFDPIHYGHLRPAAEVMRALAFSELRIIPAANPPHRQAPIAPFDDRLRMAELAAANEPGFVVDDREGRFRGPSYTVHTLESLRAEPGMQSLCLLMGTDTFRGLESWFEWKRLFELAHIVVMERPGVPMPALEASLPPWARPRLSRERGELALVPAGRIVLERVHPQDISASAIRAMIAAGRSPQGLLPEGVWHYVKQRGLYGYRGQRA